MNLDLFLAYLVTIAIFFATPPGPSQLLMIANSATHGLKSSLATLAGDLSANVLQMTAAAFGLAALIATSATALGFVKWAGVAYLLYVGVKTFRAAPRPVRAAGGKGTLLRLYRQGFFTSAANPKAVVFFAALFPQFIDPNLPIWPQLLALGAVYLVVDGVILCLYGRLAECYLGALGQGAPRRLNRIAGAMMIGAAALLGLKEVAPKPIAN